MIKRFRSLVIFFFLFFAFTGAAEQVAVIPPAARRVADRFNADHMRADLQFLSSDLLEGRGTGARGGDIAAAYIATQFALAGLKPLGDNGTYMQKVPLIGLTTQPESALSIVPKTGEAMPLKYLDDFVANALTLNAEETVDAPAVFVGFGIHAPEFQWNDFAGVDVKGNVIIALVNDPADDPNAFGGKAMTYYGRWTYKYEEAARQQAAGILLIHNTEMAAYGWKVVRNSNSGEQAYLENPPGQYAVPMAGWITKDVAGKMFASAGFDLADLFAKAKTRGFHAMEMPLRIQAHLIGKVRPLHAENVIAILEGSDPRRKDEAIVYTAHYDHLGIGVPVDGDSIYNGALDNGSGTALLLELARVFASSPVRPPRSIVFLSVTGEERGLRGSEYYGKNPKIPAKKTMLDLNYDKFYLVGQTRDLVLTGAQRTSVWPIVHQICHAMNLNVAPEPDPNAGHYYRSDHFNFARIGVPAFSVDLGENYIGKPSDFGAHIRTEYYEKHYHQPSDEFDPDWDYSGAKEIARFGIYLAWRVAEQSGSTGWQPGDEFEQARK